MKLFKSKKAGLVMEPLTIVAVIIVLTLALIWYLSQYEGIKQTPDPMGGEAVGIYSLISLKEVYLFNFDTYLRYGLWQGIYENNGYGGFNEHSNGAVPESPCGKYHLRNLWTNISFDSKGKPHLNFCYPNERDELIKYMMYYFRNTYPGKINEGDNYYIWQNKDYLQIYAINNLITNNFFNPKAIGKYKFNGKSQVKYNLLIYIDLKNFSNTILNECSKLKDRSKCVQDNVNKFNNFLNKKYSGKKLALGMFLDSVDQSRFTDEFDFCVHSQQNNCFCDYVPDELYSCPAYSLFDGFSTDVGIMNFVHETFGEFEINNGQIISYKTNWVDFIIPANSHFYMFKQPGSNIKNKVLYPGLYKPKNGVDLDQISNFYKYPPLQCYKDRKVYSFVLQEDTYVLTSDQHNPKLKYPNIYFSLQIPDNASPNTITLNTEKNYAIDSKVKDRSILLSWERKDDDIKKYMVCIFDKSFNQDNWGASVKALNQAIPTCFNVIMNISSSDLTKYIYDRIDLEKDFIVEQGKGAVFNAVKNGQDEKLILKSNTLYYDYSNDRYVFLLRNNYIFDETVYNIAVVPYDYYNNYPKFESVSLVPNDDLMPGVISNLNVISIPNAESGTKTVTVTWNAPQTNMDGTNLDDLKGYKVIISKTPISGLLDIADYDNKLNEGILINDEKGYFQTLSEDASTETIPIQLSFETSLTSIYYIAVIPFDYNNNPGEGIKMKDYEVKTA